MASWDKNAAKASLSGSMFVPMQRFYVYNFVHIYEKAELVTEWFYCVLKIYLIILLGYLDSFLEKTRRSPLKPNGSHHLFPQNPRWTIEDGKPVCRIQNFENRKPKRFRKLLPPQPNSPQMLYRAHKKVNVCTCTAFNPLAAAFNYSQSSA